MRNHRAFTLIEVALAGVLFAVILASVSAAVSGDKQTARVILAQVGPELKGQRALECIASELRMAGLWGEDVDQDGVWDEGEDTNGNGAFDANWSLADGAVDQTSITFNRRIDEFDEAGNLLTTGIYSRPVSYRLAGDALVREWQVTGPGGVETRRSIIASRVGGLRFSRNGKIVTISLDVLLPKNVYKSDRRTVSTQVWLRN